MLGKPLTESEADALTGSGLEVVSNYQFGKGETSDWLGGYQAGLKHARRGLELHRAAGGPDDRPIYVSIDDNPTFVQFTTQIVPYLLAWQEVSDLRTPAYMRIRRPSSGRLPSARGLLLAAQLGNAQGVRPRIRTPAPGVRG